MHLLRVLKNAKCMKEFRSLKYMNARFQSTEARAKNENVIKARRFLKPLSKLELKLRNDNFVTTIFGGSFNNEILEYPQVFEDKEISTILDHSTALEEFLNNNPKIELNEETISELKGLELFGLSIPQKYGGAGYNRTEINFLLECAGIESHLARFIGCNEDYGCRLLSLYGNEEQKAQYLPKLAEGKSRMSLAFLESGSMIDFSNFEGYSILDKQNDGFILNVKKKWVHHANLSDLILVLVKMSSILEEENATAVKFNMFILDRNTPGVTVHKVLNNNLEGFSMYELDIQDAFVPQKNLLGDMETCGVTALKTALSHSFLTDSVLCCSLLKQLIHGAYTFIKENKVFEKLEKGYIMTQNNLGTLTMNAFVLESVAYLLSGRFDTHAEHDLFDESVLTKIIAIDMLKSSIERYIEIVGCESLKEPGILEEGLKVLQYYTLMDENIEYMKMMVGGNGLCFASMPLSSRVMKLRNYYDNFGYSMKNMLKNLAGNKEVRDKFRLKGDLHSSLSSSAELLETSLAKFLIAIEETFIKKGNEIIENEHVLIKFAEMAAYLYALTACLSRASSSICYDFEKFEIDLGLAEKFAVVASNKIEDFIQGEVEFIQLSIIQKEVGKITFNCKGYPASHPLSRTY